MFEAALHLLRPYRGLTAPPPAPVKLWSEGGRDIWIDNAWGPAVPYPAVDHQDGGKNHGYMRTKRDIAAIRRIPEAADFPALAELLTSINALTSPIESVGCEKSLTPFTAIPGATVLLGSYVDLIFTDTGLNDTPENALLLACRLASAIEGCERWWADVSMVLQRLRFLAGTTHPWGLMLQTKNGGRTEEEARKFWAETAGRMAKAVAALPQDFKWSPNSEGAGGPL
jgi:hypothetical protein